MLQPPEARKIGDYDYRYARVAAETVYLWRKRQPAAAYYNPWPDPFWAPWGPYGPWWDGSYGPW